MRDLRITIVQAKLFWENKKGNLNHFTTLLKKVKKDSTDVLILPEMFTTGFSMDSKKLAESMQGEGVEWMREKAAGLNAAVTGSLIIKEGNDYFNRLIWINPDGNIFHYDKRHLFRMAKEDNYFSSGSEKLVIEFREWRICPMICYDLRFPVWCRNIVSRRYDLILFIASWPERRIEHWKQLLVARAIENQSYVAGVNRVGTDGNKIAYNGNSVVLDSRGKKLSRTRAGVQSVETVKLSALELEKTRRVLPFLNDADEFELLT
ncbi:MAG: amidohydrolase [Bacteroidia bacterium]|nr:amidohydrolase [Bacteroidia bacterium]MCZ2276458.1 amidohydrolase [Bacteroidia bacterium]